MKEGIHPEYYQATVTCNCGNTFVTGSTKKDIHVEICSKCHSFYTGQQKAAAARGRIDKFRNTASNNKRFGYRSIQMSCESRMYMLKIMRGVEVEKSQPFLSHGFFVWIF